MSIRQVKCQNTLNIRYKSTKSLHFIELDDFYLVVCTLNLSQKQAISPHLKKYKICDLKM